MGKLQRSKGKIFERWSAQKQREYFPECLITRGQQANGASHADNTGIPGLWTECQDSKQPTPLAKLQQAIEDASKHAPDCVPIAVFHRYGTPMTSTRVCLLLKDLLFLGRDLVTPEDRKTQKVTVEMNYDEFLAFYGKCLRLGPVESSYPEQANG